MSFSIGNAISFRTYIDLCQEDSDAVNWVVFEDHLAGYTVDMKLFPVAIRNDDIEPEEYEALEDQVLEQGYANALNPDQIVDVVDNLRRLRPDFSDADLARAVSFYSAKDTFIDAHGLN